MRASLVLLCSALLLPGATAFAQTRDSIVVVDSTQIQRIRLSDGSTVVGRIVRIEGDSLVFRTSSAELRLSRDAVRRVETSSADRLRNGEYWPENPNATRLIFAPTGRQLKAGDGYFSNYMLFFVGVAGGLNDHVTLGGGMSIFPSDEFLSNNFYYLTPKVGLVQSDRFNLSAGALIGFAGFADEGGSFGVLYGVATQGSRDHSVTGGLGWGYADGSLANAPVLMLGTEQRLTRRTSFVSENYIFLGDGELNFVSYGIRFMGEKISVDFALVNSLTEPVTPGIPFIGLVVAF
jgi:hypothetical protein